MVKKRKELNFIALLHLVDWDLDEEEVEISSGISICQYNNSMAQQIYETLCYRKGIDDREPCDYGAYFFLKDHDGIPYSSGYDIYGAIPELCNILAIASESVVGMCRVIQLSSKNNCINTTMEHHYSSATEFLTHKRITINKSTIEVINICYHSLLHIHTLIKKQGRKYSTPLDMAFDYYNYAWRGFYIDQTCIHLSIVLEALFSPSSNTELSHQIAYNVSCFMKEKSSEREDLYNLVKKFYNIRSCLVHGTWPEKHDYCGITEQVFELCSRILRKILTNSDLTDIFLSRSKRDELLKILLFYN